VEPRLVESSQGSSVLKTIEYKQRFLYSKYNPARAVTTLIESLNILPGTMIIIASPGLWYGLDELLKKVPDSCEIIAVECDEKLYTLSSSLNDRNIPFYRFSSNDDLLKLDSVIREITSSGYIRRAVKIDFCAGVQFFTDKYNLLINASTNLISSFWKNRITLTKLGKLYAKNIFRNLIKMPHGSFAWNYYNKINSPVLVCGAGEGIENLDPQYVISRYFVLCVDAALSCLSAKGIKPDAVICEESQLAIEKMFIGQDIRSVPLFMDITSRPGISKLSEKIIWYSTEYSQNRLLQALKDNGILRDFMTPNGSVGLTAVELALKLRKDDSVPVYVAGLDFSYSAGKTHASGTNPHITRLNNSCREKSIYNMDASFADNIIKMAGKNNRTVFTTQILTSYAQSFINSFSFQKNIFDYSETGINLNIPHKTDIQQTAKKDYFGPCEKSDDNLKIIQEFYSSTRQDLETVIELLKDGDNSKLRNAQSLTEQIESLLADKDYLWLHFPDGFGLKTDSSFLKRIRAEIICFIKQIDTALNEQ